MAARAAKANAVPNSPMKKKRKRKPGVLDHVARDQLRLGDRHVERRLGELGLRRDHEEEEADELGEDEGVADATESEDRAVLLDVHDALQVHRAGLDHHADDGEHERELVGDQLGRGAQRADQRELVGARPARHQARR